MTWKRVIAISTGYYVVVTSYMYFMWSHDLLTLGHKLVRPFGEHNQLVGTV